MKIVHELVQQDKEAGRRLWEFLSRDTVFGNYEYVSYAASWSNDIIAQQMTRLNSNGINPPQL